MTVEKGKEDTVAIAVKDPISMVIKSSEKELYKPIFTANKETLEAEVKKGTVVGKVHLEKTEGTDYGYIVDQAAEVDVVTTEAVERSSWISLMFQGNRQFFR